MYGSARARVYYGAGDYNRAYTMAQGYYAAGGFFDFIKKGVAAVSKVAAPVAAAVSKVAGGPLGSLLKAVPVVGTGLQLANLAGGIIGPMLKPKGVEQGPSAASVRQLGAAGVLNPKVPLAGLPSMRVERGRSTRRRRRSSTRSTGRSSRRRRRRGDYGDDWNGNRPSRAKGSGQFLTRAGGRRRRRRRGGRRSGQRVTFTTKTGKRVSFIAK